MSLHYSWGNPLNCLYTIFKVVKILTLIYNMFDELYCSINPQYGRINA